MENIKKKKSPIWCLSISRQFSFPTSVHENFFIIARDINIVVITIVTVHMDDALWCQHLLNYFSWSRQRLALFSTKHKSVVSAAGVHGQVRQLYSLSCLVFAVFVLLPTEVFKFWWEKGENPYLQVCTS